jgi:DNA (cytosine-5)-methyltransferase 1
MFVKRIHKYAVKKLKNGAARIYIQNSDCLRKSQLSENTCVKIKYMTNRIEVIADKDGENKIMETGRGALLELKNKKTAKSIGDVDKISVTFRTGKVIITLHYKDKMRMEREMYLIDTLVKGKPIRKASFFSGLGMLSYHLKVGLSEVGIKSQICFANDSSNVAMELNLASNPMWKTPTKDALAIIDDLENLDLSDLPQAHLIEIGYPCLGQSTLCAKENRDINHPVVGTLFVKLIAALEKMNAPIVLFENTPAFCNSKTLDIIKREMIGYRFEEIIINAHDFGEIEARKRTCVVAVSEGLPDLNLSKLMPNKERVDKRNNLSDFLEEIPLDSPLWRKMDHLKRKTLETGHNYKNVLYSGPENLIATITASYAAPKAGTPMIRHPINHELQRQVTPLEHARIRRLPEQLLNDLMEISNGKSPMVSKIGSKSLAHRILGNGLSKYVWNEVGTFLGNYLIKCRDLTAFKQHVLFAG